MYRIDVVALLPELVRPVCEHGVVGRAVDNGLVQVDYTSPRDFAHDRHRTVDDRPYGGGPGMVLKYEPLRDAARAGRAALPKGCRTVLLAPHGRVFDQDYARELASAMAPRAGSRRRRGAMEDSRRKGNGRTRR